ncbi:unnamed protein product, partial [Prorocentrum cordatum]
AREEREAAGGKREVALALQSTGWSKTSPRRLRSSCGAAGAGRWLQAGSSRSSQASWMLACMREEQAARAEPLVVEGAGIIGTERWADVEGHLGGLLGDRAVLVKRSPSQRFRYFDLKKNTGRYDFKQPLREEQMCLRDFLAESRFILEEGRAERMYLQETLSGHAEMAEEFASWRWELLIRVSSACGCP